MRPTSALLGTRRRGDREEPVHTCDHSAMGHTAIVTGANRGIGAATAAGALITRDVITPR